MKNSSMRGVALLGALIVVHSMAGCGGSDDEAAPETSGDGDEGRSNIECVAASDTGAGGAGAAVCVNDTDCSGVEDGSIRTTAKNCYVASCSGSDDIPTCIAECLVDELGTTEDCSSCYGASALCSADNCLEECISNVDAPECVECQADNGCTESFFSCSGLAQPE